MARKSRRRTLPGLPPTDELESDFIAATPPEETGPGTTPELTPEDIRAQFRVLTWANWEPPPEGRRGRIYQPEYNFTEIAQATDTDGIFRNSYDRQLICVMKERWWVGGKNPRAVAYVQRRLHEISRMSQAPFDIILQQCAQDLIEFGNFFLYMHRDRQKSSGKPVTVAGKEKDPIAALQPVDVTTMYPKVGDTIEIRSWHQFLDGRLIPGRRILIDPEQSDTAKRYPTEDIIHGFVRKRTGFVFGTPAALPVLDDVRALRRLEEISELIAHKHAFPLIHIAIGSEKMPARILANGKSEVDLARDVYEKLPLEGAYFTTERIKVTAISATPMDLTALLKHFQDRAVTGLGLSDMDMGRGGTANRGTAVLLSRAMMDRCRHYQQMLCIFFTWYLFDILLLEGGFALTPENRVHLKFPEVDAERMMSVNNHAMALYQGGAITEAEMRAMMGRDPITDTQRSDMYFERQAVPLAIIKAVDEPYTAAAKLASKGAGGTTATASKNQPTNQEGRKLARTTPANDMLEQIQPILLGLQNRLIAYVEQQCRVGQSIDDRTIRQAVADARISLETVLADFLSDQIKLGMERYRTDSNSGRVFVVGEPLRRRFRNHCLREPLDRLLGDTGGGSSAFWTSDISRLIDTLRSCTDGKYVLKISAFFDVWDVAWDSIFGQLEKVAQRFGYAHAAWIDDAHEVEWKFAQTPCSRCCKIRGMDPETGLDASRLSPAQTDYAHLVDRDCDVRLSLVDSGRLPSRVPLDVVRIDPTLDGFKVCVRTGERADFLDLSKPGRFLRICLDKGEQALLPGEPVEGFGYEGDGVVRIPGGEPGVLELWDQGRIVGRTRFSPPLNGGLHAHSEDTEVARA